MSINWKRGLFRLWLVFSILWLMGGGWLSLSAIKNSQDTSTAFSNFEAGVEKVESGKILPLDFLGPSHPPTPVTIKDATGKEREYFLKYTDEEEYGRLLWKRRTAKMSSVYAVVGTLAPPLLLLILGSAFFWILSGFRGKPPAA